MTQVSDGMRLSISKPASSSAMPTSPHPFEPSTRPLFAPILAVPVGKSHHYRYLKPIDSDDPQIAIAL
jgi:hypothetical protein